MSMNSREGMYHRYIRWRKRPEKPMEEKPLLSHLMALRKTLLVCLSAIGIGFLVVFINYSDQLIGLLTQPLEAKGIDVIFTDISEAFITETKLSLIVGIVAASPVIFGAIWWFVRPALKRRERIYAAGFLVIAAFLFALGIYFAYRCVFFLAVNFFITEGEGLASPMLSIGKYVDFLFGFLLPFGVMFELPVVITWLTRLSIVTPEGLKKARKYIVFTIFVIAAILTPPDVVSQVMLALPMVALFEVGIVCSKIAQPGRRNVLRPVAGGKV